MHVIQHLKRSAVRPCRIWAVLGAVIVLLQIAGMESAAQSLPPYAIQGTLTLNGSSAAANTQVAVTVNGQTLTTTTSATGAYFLNLENGSQGDAITYQVDGHEIAESYVYQEGGGASNLAANLSDSAFTTSVTQAVSGSAPVTFTMQNGAVGVVIDPNGNDLGSTAVQVKANQDCTSVAGETVQRCFDISPTTAQSVDITFFFFEDQLSGQACGSLKLFHWTGSWIDVDSGGTHTTRVCRSGPFAQPHTITVNNVSNFSPFVLRATSAPTAVQLVGFSAQQTVGVRWLAHILLGLLAGWVLVISVIWRKRQQENAR